MHKAWFTIHVMCRSVGGAACDLSSVIGTLMIIVENKTPPTICTVYCFAFSGIFFNYILFSAVVTSKLYWVQLYGQRFVFADSVIIMKG